LAYDIDLFTPETHQAFSTSARDISSFQEGHKGIAARWVTSDQMKCELTELVK
jgi:hypothetical protein